MLISCLRGGTDKQLTSVSVLTPSVTADNAQTKNSCRDRLSRITSVLISLYVYKSKAMLYLSQDDRFSCWKIIHRNHIWALTTL